MLQENAAEAEWVPAQVKAMHLDGRFLAAIGGAHTFDPNPSPNPNPNLNPNPSPMPIPNPNRNPNREPGPKQVAPVALRQPSPEP